MHLFLCDILQLGTDMVFLNAPKILNCLAFTTAVVLAPIRGEHFSSYEGGGIFTLNPLPPTLVIKSSHPTL